MEESGDYVPSENDIRIAIDVIAYLQQNPDVVQTSALIRKLRYFCKVYINTKRKDKMRDKKQRVIENDIAKLEKTGIRMGREERKKKTFERLKLQLPIEWHPQEMLPENPDKEFVNLPSDQIREIETKSLPSTTPKPPDTLQTSYLDCYICKKSVKTVHHFYDQLCTSCGDLNFEKRHQTTNLEGKVALVTGGRIKIGFEVVLKLVRAGALVIVTTRFPKDAVLRFSAEKDFNEWSHRLHIYALDLRFIPSIEQFAEHLKATYSQLDIIIHNAAQTIRRPPIFYRHLIPIEKSLEFTDERKQGMIKSFGGSPMITAGGSEVSLIGDQGELGQGISGLTALQKVNEKIPLVDITQIPLTPEDKTMDPSLFPVQEYDEHGQQADRRVDNSWFTRIEDVSTVEMAEVHIVNTMAPFILTSKLRPLLTKDQPTFIINVSSMEGKFSRTKTAYHPHTNMAKASLNMMTRTCSREFAMHNIYMNSVDTGWITYENPLEYDAVKQILKLSPPIDEIDGASRILDPIFHALKTGENYWGLFYKDYMPSSW